MLSSPTQVMFFCPAFQAPKTRRSEKSSGKMPRMSRYDHRRQEEDVLRVAVHRCAGEAVAGGAAWTSGSGWARRHGAGP